MKEGDLMIDFSEERWDTVRSNYKKWWDGTLGRPILPIVFFGGKEPGRPCPNIPPLHYGNVNDFSISPEQIIERMDYDLSCIEWAGDGYPLVYTHQFGAGVAAAFMGCELNARPDTVWFHSEKVLPIEELHFEYDPDNKWLRRIKDIYIAGMEKWKGSVLMAMTDIGGILDILVSFRTTENLLYDLYDSPDEVLRCVREIQTMWFRYFDEINAIIAPCTPGYSTWSSIYDEKPTYMLQSDFCYMLSPEMFDIFVQPELSSSASRINHAFYHMDGVGQLPSLQSLLSIESIKGIQWVPGDGESLNRDWTGLYSQIESSGKKIQATYMQLLDDKFIHLVKNLKSADSVTTHLMGYPASEKEAVKRAAYEVGLEMNLP